MNDGPDPAAIRAQLAAIEHERWGAWQLWMHQQCERQRDGSLVIPAALVARWERQIATNYADLSPREQASDLEQVDRYWRVIQDLLDAQAERLAQLSKERWAVTVTDALREAQIARDMVVEAEQERVAAVRAADQARAEAKALRPVMEAAATWVDEIGSWAEDVSETDQALMDAVDTYRAAFAPLEQGGGHG